MNLLARLRGLFDVVDPMPAAIPPADPPLVCLEPVPQAGTRGSTLTFGDGQFTVEVECGARLTGLIIPAAGELEVRWPDGGARVPVDEHGLFEVDDVPSGPVRLVIGDVATAWFVR
jgi:hypothetical protein